MHGTMGGWHEIRPTGPSREQFRLFCLLENADDLELSRRGLPKPAIAGMRKPWRTKFSEADRDQEPRPEHGPEMGPGVAAYAADRPRSVRSSALASGGSPKRVAAVALTPALLSGQPRADRTRDRIPTAGHASSRPPSTTTWAPVM
jgi:hypothetical protein